MNIVRWLSSEAVDDDEAGSEQGSGQGEESLVIGVRGGSRIELSARQWCLRVACDW